MGFQVDQVVTGYQSGSPRQRLISMLLSAAIVILALLFAIYQTEVAPLMEKKPKNPVTFDMSDRSSDAGQKSPERHEQAKKAEKAEKATPKKRVEAPSNAPVPPVVEPTTKPIEKPAFTFLKMSSNEMAAADIGQMKKPDTGASGASSAAGNSGGPSGSTYGPGEGPGGAVLYNADWYKRPSDAELGGYLPANRPASGWGMIACQTIEHYHVENCEILGESPRGSGLGRAVLNAAWQFQVIPPRINGKSQLGTWVKIRIDYSRTAPGDG